jgi:threonine dehydrogenase-like Zn-dependent dehydrogenase
MATMTGVVLPGNRQLQLRTYSVPEPLYGQVLIRMKASALCGSDLRAIYRPQDQGTGPEAYRGVIAGHEPCGIIERVGPGGRRFKVGDQVIGYHIAGARHLCLEAAREWGRVVFVGEGGTVSFAPSPLLIYTQLTLYGSWMCSLPQMEELVELLVRWHLHPDVLVTHMFPLA